MSSERSGLANHDLLGAHSRREFMIRGGQSALALSALGALASCDGEAEDSQPAPRRGGVIEITGLGTTADSLDPVAAVDNFEFFSPVYFFDRLTTPKKLPSTEVDPALAESWDSSSDLRTWEFKLRSGVTFHDGKPLEAADVVHTMRRALNPKLGTEFAALDPWFTADGVKAVDKQTVRFELKRPNAYMPIFLSLRTLAIVQDGAVAKDFRRPIGTGPFQVRSFTPGESLEAERFQDYWVNGRPYLDGLRWVGFADITAAAQSVIQGTAHLAAIFVSEKLARLADASSNAEAVSFGAGSSVRAMIFNNKKPFNDPRVREALQLSFDREQIAETLFSAVDGAPSVDVVAFESDPLYPTDLPIPQFDPTRAKKLLAEAGQEGLRFEVSTADVTAGYNEIAIIYKEIAAESGINATVRQVAPASYFSTAYLQVPVFMGSWGVEPIQTLPRLIFAPGSPLNESGYDNPKPAELFADAVGEPDEALAREMIGEACALVQNTTTHFFPISLADQYIRKTNLKGVKLVWNNYYDVTSAYIA